jgi:hypothetical protein
MTMHDPDFVDGNNGQMKAADISRDRFLLLD